MKVAITSGGVEGQAAQRYWEKQGAEVTVLDWHQPDYLDHLDTYDLIVRSPGTHPNKIKTAKPVTSVTREFFAQCPVPIIGVTGTKGKGTTSSLIAKILEAAHSTGSGQAGHKVWLGGNIGVPALDFLDKIQDGDKVVLELSSFQLFDLQQSPHIGVMLMIADDHLDVHTDRSEYEEAKANIFRYQSADDVAIYYAKDTTARRLVAYSKGQHLPYFDEQGAYIKDGQVYFQDMAIMPVSEIGLVGEHNWQNVCAAVAAAWEAVKDPSVLRTGIREFTGLPHRLKLVGEVDGVRYYDDSIATTPESAMAAIAAFKEPKVLILGGSDKGAAWGELAVAVKNGNVVRAILIGQTAPAIAAALDAADFSDYQMGADAMDAIVGEAATAAQSGMVVLLAPACASFDMFTSYADRGEQFTKSVALLG